MFSSMESYLRWCLRSNINATKENVAEKSAEIGYDPTKGTNWCHLSMEMRDECITHMDVETAIRLSCTSKTEKSLTDSANFHIYRLDINYFSDNLQISTQDLNDYPVHFDSKKSRDKHFNFMKFVLKRCNIISFAVCSNNGTGLFDVLSQCVPFKFKKFTTDCKHLPTIEFVLNNCENLETLAFHSDGFTNDETFRSVRNLPSAANIREFCLMYQNDLSLQVDHIRQWINNDADVGKALHFVSSSTETIDQLAQSFSERIIYQTEKEVRIQMNDETKQILFLEVYKDTDDEFISCKVIPAGLPESEYRKKDKWMLWRSTGNFYYQNE